MKSERSGFNRGDLGGETKFFLTAASGLSEL